jgi:hypothetical protein
LTSLLWKIYERIVQTCCRIFSIAFYVIAIKRIVC